VGYLLMKMLGGHNLMDKFIGRQKA